MLRLLSRRWDNELTIVDALAVILRRYARGNQAVDKPQGLRENHLLSMPQASNPENMLRNVKNILCLGCRMSIGRTTASFNKPSQMVKKVFFALLLADVLFNAGCALKSTSTVITLNHATVVNKEALVLSGNDSLEIISSHYIQNNNIILRDNATLLIRNSSFEHRHDHSFQYQLRAYDNASVIIENSEIGSSDWLIWYFDRNSSLVLRNVKNHQSAIWHVFLASAFAQVARSTGSGEP